MQKEFNKETKTFVTNGEDIDLREYVNEPPGRQGKNPVVDAKNTVLEMGKTDKNAAQAFLEEMMRQLGIASLNV